MSFMLWLKKHLSAGQATATPSASHSSDADAQTLLNVARTRGLNDELVAALVELRPPELTPWLLELVRQLPPPYSNAPDYRRRQADWLYAARALAKLKESAAVEPLLAGLRRDDEFYCRTILQSLGELGDGRAVSHIVPCRLSYVPGVPRTAVEALTHIQTDEATQALQALLKNPGYGSFMLERIAALELEARQALPADFTPPRCWKPYNPQLLQAPLTVAEYAALRQPTATGRPPSAVPLEQLPTYITARCPFCQAANRERLDTYSLYTWDIRLQRTGLAVYGNDETPVVERCPHFALVQPFLHLHSMPVADEEQVLTYRGPFIIGHLLEKHDCQAVMHALPICRIEGERFTPRYTLFTVSYFTRQPPEAIRQAARAYHRDRYAPGWKTPLVETPPCACRHWSYLGDWVKAGQLHWLETADPLLPLRTTEAAAFPYSNILNFGPYEESALVGKLSPLTEREEKMTHDLRWKSIISKRPDGNWQVKIQHQDDEDVPGMGHIEIWGQVGDTAIASSHNSARELARRLLRKARAS